MNRNRRSATQAAFDPMHGSALQASMDSVNYLENLGKRIDSFTKPPSYGVVASAGILDFMRMSEKVNAPLTTLMESLNASTTLPARNFASWYGSMAKGIVKPVNTFNLGAAAAAVNYASANTRGIVGDIQMPMVRATFEVANWNGALFNGMFGSANTSALSMVLEVLERTHPGGIPKVAAPIRTSRAAVAVHEPMDEWWDEQWDELSDVHALEPAPLPDDDGEEEEESVGSEGAPKGVINESSKLLRLSPNDTALARAADATLESQWTDELIAEFKGDRFDQLLRFIEETDNPALEEDRETKFEKVPNGEASSTKNSI